KALGAPGIVMALLLTRPPDAEPEWLDDYVAFGGYAALSRALKNSPDAVLEAVRASGLRGRGGAGFPAWQKWELARASESPTKHVVVNGGEHEPGSRKDRLLVARYPHRVL